MDEIQSLHTMISMYKEESDALYAIITSLRETITELRQDVREAKDYASDMGKAWSEAK